MRLDAIIGPEIAAAQAIKGRGETGKFFDSAFAKEERGCL